MTTNVTDLSATEMSETIKEMSRQLNYMYTSTVVSQYVLLGLVVFYLVISIIFRKQILEYYSKKAKNNSIPASN